MRVLLVCLLAAISYAQTEWGLKPEDMVELPGSCNGVRTLSYVPQSEWAPEEKLLMSVDESAHRPRCEIYGQKTGHEEMYAMIEPEMPFSCGEICTYDPEHTDAASNHNCQMANGHPYLDIDDGWYWMSILGGKDNGFWTDRKDQYAMPEIEELECYDFPIKGGSTREFCKVVITDVPDGGTDGKTHTIARNWDGLYKAGKPMGFIRDQDGNIYNNFVGLLEGKRKTVDEMNEILKNKYGDKFEYFEWTPERDVYMPSVNPSSGKWVRYQAVNLITSGFSDTDENMVSQLVEYCGESDSSKDTSMIIIVCLVVFMNLFLLTAAYYYCRRNEGLRNQFKNKYEIDGESEI